MQENLIFKLNQAITLAQQAKYLAPGATDEQTRSFRQALGLQSEQLPDSFYAFYRWHNGSAPGKYDTVPFHKADPLLSLENIVGSWQIWKELADRNHFSEYVPGAWCDSAWIPYIETDWYVQVIDTRGSFGGQPGQILGFDYKSTSERSILHASFDDWLASMLALIEAGLWRPGNLSEEQYEAQQGQHLTRQEEERVYEIMKKLNPGYPWHAELHHYRKTAVENAPNPHWAQLQEAIRSHDLASVQRLIEQKQIGVSEQNVHEIDSFTPLHLAGRYDAWQIALWLVQQGADLSIKDAYGFTPLHCLIDSLPSYFDPNRSINAQSDQIISIFDAAIERGHSLRLHNLAVAAIRMHDTQLLGYALEHGCDPNAIPRFFNHNLLYETIEERWFSGYEQLLRAGADPTQLNKNGLTITQFVEKQLEQQIHELAKYPRHCDPRLIINLADFFRAEGRLGDFLTQTYQHFKTYNIQLDDKQHNRGLSITMNILRRMEEDEN